jgi:tRNA A-37 threonylcarbamoyl transferase component Bud32/tetratricopeptide (TPR) repeat protein
VDVTDNLHDGARTRIAGVQESVAETAAEPGTDCTGVRGDCIDHDQLLDLMEVWEEGHRQGEDRSPESLGSGDPVLTKALCALVARQKRLYARLRLPEPPDAGPDGGDGPLPSFPDHETLAKIGQGGMGAVYKARDTKLGRIVAIKTISDGQSARGVDRGRFQAEAQAIARLRHPHIIAIHAIGEHEGRPFFSMEYAEGGSLGRLIAEGPMPATDAALIVEKLATAVHAAHTAGIVHRDLKPSNVLVMQDGSPKVSDFGLAKLLESDSGQTLSGQILGSPSYMAPEQAEGRSKQVGPAADIYALGAVLYQSLAGRPPFQGETPIETLKLVVSTEVVRPRQQRPGIPRDLETICLKCLEKDPRKRYASAQDLALDLRRFDERRPILARRASRLERSLRWCRRNPWVAAFLVATILGAIASTMLAVRARLAEAATRAERDRAVQARDHALGAVQILLKTDGEMINLEEMRPYRKRLVAEGLRESQALVHDLEGDPRAELQLIDAYLSLSSVEREGSEYALALGSARKALALAEKRLAEAPGSMLYQEKRAAAYHRISTSAATVDECLPAARRSTELYRSLCASHPDGDRLSWMLQIARNQFNTGNYLSSLQRFPEAIESFVEARTAYDDIMEMGDRTPETRDLKGRNLLYLCRLYHATDHFDESIAAGTQSMAIFRALVAEHPARYPFAHQLFLVHAELGLSHLRANQADEGIAAYQSARRILKEMEVTFGRLVSRMAAIQGWLAETDYNLMDAYDTDLPRYHDVRREVVSEAYSICDKLGVNGPLPWNSRIVYAASCYEMARYQEWDGQEPDMHLLNKSERLWKEILRESPADTVARPALVIVCSQLADMLEKQGQKSEASGMRVQALAAVQGHPEACYEAAREYAKWIPVIGKPVAGQELAWRERYRSRLADKAIGMVAQAVALGFKDARKIKTDPRLGPIRSDPRFQTIVADLVFPLKPFASQ